MGGAQKVKKMLTHLCLADKDFYSLLILLHLTFTSIWATSCEVAILLNTSVLLQDKNMTKHFAKISVFSRNLLIHACQLLFNLIQIL